MSLPGVRGGSTTTRESLQKSEISTDSVQAAPWLGCTPPSSITVLAWHRTCVTSGLLNGKWKLSGKNCLKKHQNSAQVEILTQMLNDAQQSTPHAEHRGAPHTSKWFGELEMVWRWRNQFEETNRRVEMNCFTICSLPHSIFLSGLLNGKWKLKLEMRSCSHMGFGELEMVCAMAKPVLRNKQES